MGWRPVAHGDNIGPMDEPHFEAEKVEREISLVVQSLVCFSLRQTSKLMQCSIAHVRNLVKDQKLKGFYQGAKLLVPAWSISHYQNDACGRYEIDHKVLVKRFDPKTIESAKRLSDARQGARGRMPRFRPGEMPQQIQPAV